MGQSAKTVPTLSKFVTALPHLKDYFWRSVNNAFYKNSETFMSGPQCQGSLSIAWWNTSVSPYGNGQSTVDTDKVLQTIFDLSDENDLVGLGEFDDERLGEAIIDRLPRYKRFKSLYHESGKLKFKTALIYDSRLLEPIDIDKEYANLVKSDAATIPCQYRIGQKARFRISCLEALVDVYLIHWNQKDEPFGDDRKTAAAARLNRDIFGNEQCWIGKATAIVMGDFNSEPCSRVFIPLNVSRSSQYIMRKGGLYNPFWRRLHDEIGTLNEANCCDIRCDRVLFDSIMVTSNFLQLPNCKWRERVYGCNFYDPKPKEHSPIGLKITWRN